MIFNSSPNYGTPVSFDSFYITTRRTNFVSFSKSDSSQNFEVIYDKYLVKKKIIRYHFFLVIRQMMMIWTEKKNFNWRQDLIKEFRHLKVSKKDQIKEYDLQIVISVTYYINEIITRRKITYRSVLWIWLYGIYEKSGLIFLCKRISCKLEIIFFSFIFLFFFLFFFVIFLIMY